MGTVVKIGDIEVLVDDEGLRRFARQERADAGRCERPTTTTVEQQLFWFGATFEQLAAKHRARADSVEDFLAMYCPS